MSGVSRPLCEIVSAAEVQERMQRQGRRASSETSKRIMGSTRGGALGRRRHSARAAGVTSSTLGLCRRDVAVRIRSSLDMRTREQRLLRDLRAL